MCMYFLSKFTYIHWERKVKAEKKKMRGEWKLFWKQKLKKQTLTDIYKTLYFHEMSKCDIGYTWRGKQTRKKWCEKYWMKTNFNF